MRRNETFAGNDRRHIANDMRIDGSGTCHSELGSKAMATRGGKRTRLERQEMYLRRLQFRLDRLERRLKQHLGEDFWVPVKRPAKITGNVVQLREALRMPAPNGPYQKTPA